MDQRRNDQRAKRPAVGTAPLPVRRVRFEYPDDFEPMWCPHLPEFAAAANGISLGMPYAEPLFIKVIRTTFDDIDPELRARSESYIRQETGHHTQHKHFNDLVTARYPATARVQRWMATSARWVWRAPPKFRVAYTAAGETISYSVARWTEKNLGSLFDDADPVAATLFCWHLAEEIEHKANTYDVFEATDGNRVRYAWAAFVAFTSILFFTAIAALVQLWYEKRLRYPITWWRLTKLAISLAFELITTLVVSSLPGHHPDDFVDPVYLPRWLEGYDAERGTMPMWNAHQTDDARVRAARTPAP